MKRKEGRNEEKRGSNEEKGDLSGLGMPQLPDFFVCETEAVVRPFGGYHKLSFLVLQTVSRQACLHDTPVCEFWPRITKNAQEFKGNG